MKTKCDVLVVGAGPAGSAVASCLVERGLDVTVVEAQSFPRFSIGESLLPEALNCLDEAGLLSVVETAGYQFKDGALFLTNEEQSVISFADSFSSGKHYAYQVPRDDFDHRLANRCIEKGAVFHFATRVTDFAEIGEGYRVTLERDDDRWSIDAAFLVDASGFGRVLAKKFGLERPPELASKTAIFSHMETDFDADLFDRNKIIIAQTLRTDPFWYWLIPFAGDASSVGVVLNGNGATGTSENDLRQYVARQDLLHRLVGNGALRRDVGSITGYSRSISSLYGNRFVVLGNAGEFVDPIFSSGVTIALKSAIMAAPLIAEYIRTGREPDWNGRFETPLLAGVNTFKHYVNAWYAGTLQGIFYSPNKNEEVYRMICGVLAGYAWDRTNPYTRMTSGNLESLLQLV